MGTKRSSGSRSRPRVGLVLGAGGPVGHAYHAGVLEALHAGLGWDARDAELVVGTSAGAQVGALLRAGMSGADLARRAAGDPLGAEAAEIARHYVRPHDWFSRPSPRRLRAPAAPTYLRGVLRRPWTVRPGRLVSALLPEGYVHLDAQAEGLRRIFGARWPERSMWITAVDVDSGHRVAFGSEGAPAIDVGTAVASSGAVPSVCVPVRWGGRRYVDGGVASATHLDLLGGLGLDAVVVSAPLSMILPMRALLLREVRRLAREVPVFAFEPRGSAVRAMGRNPMAVERSPAVVRAAFESTLEDLETARRRELQRLLAPS